MHVRWFQFSLTKHISMYDGKSTVSFDLEVMNKFQCVSKLDNMESKIMRINHNCRLFL